MPIKRILERVANNHAVVRTGIAEIWTEAKCDVPDQLIEADALLYEAKAAGKDAVLLDRRGGHDFGKDQLLYRGHQARQILKSAWPAAK